MYYGVALLTNCSTKGKAREPKFLYELKFQEETMSEQSVLAEKAKGLYKAFCETEWNATTTGLVVGFFSVMIMAWWRPWGAVGAIRNWGDWIM